MNVGNFVYMDRRAKVPQRLRHYPSVGSMQDRSVLVPCAVPSEQDGHVICWPLCIQGRITAL